MKRVNLILTLVLALMLPCTLLACGKEAEKAPEATAGTPVSAYKSGDGYTDLGDEKLSREGLDALPQKYAGMTPQEAREICLTFWRYCKTALWIPDAKYDIYSDENGQQVYQRGMEQGRIYAGLPYVSTATGSIYRLLDFIDPDTGVVNVTEAGENPLTFGGMCSSGCYWAWARVMNSADYTWTHSIVTRKGFIRVGPYTYDDTIFRFSSDYGTHTVVEENGEQIMFESYAQMVAGDGMGYSRDGGVGHIVMCSIDPVVVRNEDGTIDGVNSYLHIIDQGGVWEDGVSANGLQYQYECSLDKKLTFATLFQKCYIPFTFADLIGTDPIEETEISYSYSGETITKMQILSNKATSNYAFSDIYVYIYDDAGTEVLKLATRVNGPSVKELRASQDAGHSYTWGSWDNLSPTGSYTVKIQVQLATGERPTVYEGKLAFE